jgi:hypothetical protein
MSSLVSVLAKEMDVWPKEQEYFTCDPTGEIRASLDVMYDFYPKAHVDESDRTAECAGLGDDLPRVTEAQWQAERDRQNGGEWKRHRGGECPVPAGTKVSTRHRNGEVVDVHFHTATTGSGAATMNTIWKHNGDKHDIMAYKVISQTQAEEVEVKDTNIGTISYKISVDQIAGPLAWRDTIIHCQAIIEDCEREIERNTQQLADEGFLLIAPITDVRADTPDTDPSDWRQWKAGDELECVFSTCGNIYTVGSVYTVKKTESEYAVVTDDTMSGNGTCHISGEDIADIRFIRRP